MTSFFESRLCVGQIRHRRFTPINHNFTYPMFMPLINLDELDELANSVSSFSLKKWSVASFYHKDYMKGTADTKKAVQEKIFELTGEKVTGKVMALCHLRYFGLYFSPVNFYYVYDHQDQWRYLLAEVSNTPWNERHYYAVPAGNEWKNSKEFHVSPFNPINQDYVWKLKSLKQHVFVHLETHKEKREFDATLYLKKNEFTSNALNKLLLKTPFMTLNVLFSIYWQAFKLWCKGAIFYPHPSQLKE